MERLSSPIIIRNFRNMTIKRMSIDLNKISKKIIFRQRPLLLSSNSTTNIRTSKNFCLTPKPKNNNNNKSKDSINKDITNLLQKDLLTNTEIKNKLIYIKNENINKKKNIFSKFNSLKKNIFKSKITIYKKEGYKEWNNNRILKERDIPNQTQQLFKNLKIIFGYNKLPGKDINKFKFVKPKSYIENNWWYSERKENYNESDYFSRSLLEPTCSTCFKKHSLNIIKLKKIKDERYLRNYEENKIYKSVIKKSLLRSISAFKKFHKLSNRKFLL